MTKNNPKNRAKNQEKKQYNGKDVEPIFYYGTHLGHGKYMAVRYVGTMQMVLDKQNDKPIPWDNLF